MMSEADFPQAMTPKEPGLVNIAIDTDNTAFTRILPHRNVTFICQYGFLVEIQGNHQLVIVEFAYEMPVIEISERIHQRFLAIGMLHHTEERQQRVAKLVYLQTTERFDINHRYQILLAWQALGSKVIQLLLQGSLRSEEMIGSHLESVAMREINVPLKLRVDAVSTLRGFQIDVGHLGVIAHRLPEHITLIAAQVDAVHMCTGILALQERIIIGIIQTRIRRCLNHRSSHFFLGFSLGLSFCLGFRLLFHHLRGFSTRTTLLFLRIGTKRIT